MALLPECWGSVTGLNPFWVFIAILSGARVGGLLGVIVAVCQRQWCLKKRWSLFAMLVSSRPKTLVLLPENEPAEMMK